jgi:altronate hydrolase
MAIAFIKKNEPVIKYGHAIGKATCDIFPGDWVHVHNLFTSLDSKDDVLPDWEANDGAIREIRETEKKFFMGFPRKSGRPGVRNDLWIIPAVGCVNGELRAVAAGYRKPAWIDSVKVLEHPYGCSQLGDDLAMTRKILLGLANNPNAAGVLIAGLGCESLTLDALERSLPEISDDSRFRTIALQRSSDGDIERKLDELADIAPRQRERCDASGLCVGVKCGGSDGYSGLTANPLVGRFADYLVSLGGTVLATEIPEMFGAEGMLTKRMSDKSVYEEFIALDKWFRDYFRKHGQPIYENPAPGNKDGGITTLEEKSLGAVEKTGSGTITAILGYGEQAQAGGVAITFAPGNDLVSCTSLAGSGAQIILFTTGRGTPFGSVVPTIKISTNSALSNRHKSWTDFDAGSLLEGRSWEDATQTLTDCVLRVASGERTQSEKKNIGEIAIFKDGVTL